MMWEGSSTSRPAEMEGKVVRSLLKRETRGHEQYVWISCGSALKASPFSALKSGDFQCAASAKLEITPPRTRSLSPKHH